MFPPRLSDRVSTEGIRRRSPFRVTVSLAHAAVGATDVFSW